MTSPYNNQPAQAVLGLSETGPIARVDQYTFEPIRGYPMLQWAGKRPFLSTQYYPAQHRETHGPEVDGWRNKLYWGDNLQVMSHLLKQYRGQVQLIYIDPPFDSKADYTRQITVRGQRASSNKSAFEEKQYTDIWTNDEYLQFMYERLILLRELLADSGTIFLHCDTQRGHYLKIVMDEVFGSGSFRNQIAWQRTTAHVDAKGIGEIQDLIFYYAMSESSTFNPIYQPYDDSYIASHYTSVDPDGRRYALGDMTAPRHGDGGNLVYEWKGVWPTPARTWAYVRERMEQLDREKRLHYTNTGTPRYKRYLDEMPGVPVQDIWDDISPVNAMATEKLGYPTQKPEALLERIITMCSNPGDLIFDCFMGSGTTQAVAMKLCRRFIGADINLGAVQITTKRLLAVAADLQAQQQLQRQPALLPADEGEGESDQPAIRYTGFEVYNVNNYDVFRNPVQARELLLEALEVNPLPAGSLFDGEKDGRMWKLMPINRIATRQDLNELINGFDYKALQRIYAEAPNKPVEQVTLVCMGHEPDLAARLQQEMQPFLIDVRVVDILRDKQDIQFKRDSEAVITLRDGALIIEAFWPMTLMSKLSQQKEDVTDWRELVDSVMIDWNYDGAVLEPAVVDVPPDGAFVSGRYPVPPTAGTIRVKITDLLSESLEMEVRAHA